MTIFLPTTTVTIKRGIEIDSYGDQVDSDRIYWQGLPAAITELRQRTHLPAESRGGISEEFLIRLRPGVDVQEQDRLVDEQTNTVYQITTISQPHGITGQADIRVTATRVGAQSVSP